MRRLACLAGCLLAGATTLVPAAEAAPAALLDARRAADLAVAGGEVLVAGSTARGGARLTAVPVSGGPARRVLTVRPPGHGWFPTVLLASSAQRTALLVAFYDPSGHALDWRVYAGPPSGPLALVHRVRLTRSVRLWMPVDVDVDADRVLIAEIRTPGPVFRATVLAPGVPPARVPLDSYGSSPALAGEHLAYVHVAGRAVVRFVDWLTGEPRGSTPLGRFGGATEDRDFDAAPDGRVAATVDGRLLIAGPGEPVRRLSGGPGLSAPRFAGELIAAFTETGGDAKRPVLIDPASGARRAIGPPSTALDALAADERTVAWLANGCVLAAGPDDASPDAPPAGPCPRAEVVLEEGDQVLRGRRVRVLVRCVAAPPPGCRGQVLLGRAGWAGRGRVRVPAGGRRVVAVRMSDRGLAIANRGLRRVGRAHFSLGARVVGGRVPQSFEPGFREVDLLVIDRAV